ncbi:unnamed protein product [Echinostoma caproni]|uniref:Tryptophan-rich basic protein n=1 Tax=Echinostoma caproni TaxID=27848 RepID=A0A183B8H5_9TREM|nr:unnamed protein product [Echinostoma caproni]
MKENYGKEKITSTKEKKPRKGTTVKPLELIEVTARIEQLEEDLRELQRSTQKLLSRTRNVLLHNFAEPMIHDTKARREVNRRHVQAVFRLAGVPANTPYINWVLPQAGAYRLFVPDSFGLGLTKAWNPHPQWKIWLRLWLLGTVVSTVLTTRVRVEDQVEDHIPCLTYMVI